MTHPNPRRGAAMMTALLFLSVISMLVLGMLGASVESSRWTSHEADEASVESSAESAMAVAVNVLWSDFLRAMGESDVSIWDFQAYLDGRGIPDQSEAAEISPTDLVPMLGLPRDEHGAPLMGDVRVDGLTVVRQDELSGTHLQVEVRAASRRGANTEGDNHVTTETVRATWRIEAAEWEGLEYAMLANNVNCILCHTEIDNAQRVFNDDPAKLGSFDRVKLGSIENFVLREDPHTNVAGTIYLGGKATQVNGNALASWGSLSLKSKTFDSQGKLVEDGWGNLTTENLSPASSLDPQAFENMYLDYLAEDTPQVDGYLPESFPSPFPDDGGFDFDTGEPDPDAIGNRLVDDAEFAATAKTARGTLSGGTISVLGAGETVASDADLSAMLAGNQATLGGAIDGNVYLHGTKDDPVVINGPLAVDGDLFISGYVKGKGALNVRNNVYVLDDLKYVDHQVGDSRTFGFASDGTENALAITSGGNVSVGDIFRPAWGTGASVTGDTDGSFSFIMEEMAAFNRMEWMKTQPTLPGQKTQTKVGETTVTKKVQPRKKIKVETKKKQYDKVVTGTKKVPKYKWVWVTTGSGPYQTKKKVKQQVGWKTVKTYKKVFVGWVTTWKWKWVNDGPPQWVTETKDVMGWDTPDVANPYYKGADYLPRYYAFTEDGKVPIFNKDGYFDPVTEAWKSGSLIAKGWNEDKLTIADPTDPSDSTLYGPGGAPKAVVSSITATDGWMDDALLKKLIQGALADRDPGTFEIDATLYSNNSIFGIVADRNAPTTNGKLTLNGGIVAADIGLLAPRGTTINFDGRGKDLVDISDDSRLEITRLLWAPSQ